MSGWVEGAPVVHALVDSAASYDFCGDERGEHAQSAERSESRWAALSGWEMLALE